MASTLSIKAHFRKLRDPRRRHCREHRLHLPPVEFAPGLTFSCSHYIVAGIF